MFSFRVDGTVFKKEKSIPTACVCKQTATTSTDTTIELFYDSNQEKTIDKLIDLILPAPFSDNIYFGIIYIRMTPAGDQEMLLNEFQLLDIRKNIPPKILSDISLYNKNDSEDDASSEEFEEEEEYATSEEDDDVEDLSEVDDDSQNGDIFDD